MVADRRGANGSTGNPDPMPTRIVISRPLLWALPYNVVMTINDGYLALARRLVNSLPPVAVEDIHLPAVAAADQKKDEFGFVFLDDGSVGPFYVSLDNTLEELHRRLLSDGLPSTHMLPELLQQRTLPERALAIGLFNALSASLMHRAGFEPHQANSTKTDSDTPRAGEMVGMVGYFCPLVDRLLAKGCHVLVLERQPERVEPRPGVTASTDPSDLASCSEILCTAATLINDSLDELLRAAGSPRGFSVIGPTASGLPDVLFEHGVTATGGVHFSERQALKACLAAQESWGSAGEKFQLTPANYPGIDALLEKIR